MKRAQLLILSLLISIFSLGQSWQDVGGGTNNSSHGMLVWDGKLVNLGSYNNPCNRVSTWDGTNWECLDGGVGIVARAGCVWEGKLVVVGDFWNNFQPCPGCNGVAVWDGTAWSALDQGFNNDVLTCTVHDGELYIGGDFTQANGVPVNRVVKWDTLSSTFISVGNTTSLDNDVRCMVSYDDQLWVGGDFNNVDGCSPCDGLVKWDDVNQVWEGGNSGVDLVGGVNETVRVLFVNPSDGDLYMGGHFPELWDGDAVAEDYNMAYAARYDGSNWYPLGTGMNEYVRAIHDYNGDVILGGYFTDAGGTPAQKIVKWDPINETFTAMGGGFDGGGIDEYVKSAATWNGIFFAGGAYTQAEGGPMNYIAQWYEAPSNPPTAGINASTMTICEGACVNFSDASSGSPTSWNWTFSGADTPTSASQSPGSICYSTSGSYTVQLEACNTSGCDIQTMTIDVEPIPTVSTTDQAICEGNSVTIDAVPSTTGGDYLWSPGSETTSAITVNPSSTTTYSVVYTINGCSSASEDVTVTVNPTPTLTVNNDEICEGESTTLTATPSTSGGTYNWTPNGETTSTISVSPTSTTVYTVDYTLNGCTSSLQTSLVTVNQTYNSSESVEICEGNSVTYPDGSSETITSSTTHTSMMTTTSGCDSIIVTNVTMGTNYSGSENIDVCTGSTYTYPDGFSETITASTSHTSALTSQAGCDSIIVTNVSAVTGYNETENVDACEGSTYTYPDGFTETITSSTSHTSALTSQTGCDSIVVTNVAMDNSYNENESVDVCEGSVYTYPDGFSETITSSTAHTSLLSTQAGCDSIIITNVTMNASPDNGVSMNNNILTADQSGAAYQWLDCNSGMSAISGETNQTFAPSVNGSYAVTVTLNGCSATSVCFDITSLSVSDLSNEIRVFPNPAKNEINVCCNLDLKNNVYQIIDARGRVVSMGELNGELGIDISAFEDGIYYLQIDGFGKIKFAKI